MLLQIKSHRIEVNSAGLLISLGPLCVKLLTTPCLLAMRLLNTLAKMTPPSLAGTCMSLEVR